MTDDMERRAREWLRASGVHDAEMDYPVSMYPDTLAAFARTIRREALEEAARRADFVAGECALRLGTSQEHGAKLVCREIRSLAACTATPDDAAWDSDGEVDRG